MGRKLLNGPVRLGLVTTGVGDEGARLVGHEQHRNATDELQSLDDGADPVERGLAQSGTGIGVVRGPEHGHEDLGVAHLAGGRVHDRHRLAGVVHEEPLAGHVHLAHRTGQVRLPEAVLDAKARVLVRQVVALGVLLPQQLQRHPGALELLVDQGVVRFELVARPGHRRPVEPALQLFVGELLGGPPVHPRRPGQQDELGRGALGNAQCAAALGKTAPSLQVQAQYLSNLTHRDPRCRHGSRQKSSSVCLPKRSLARPPTVHDRAEMPSTITLKQRLRSA